MSTSFIAPPEHPRLPDPYRGESGVVQALAARLDGALDWDGVIRAAAPWVEQVRQNPAPFWAMESLLREYPITSAEGLALMRLAEALLNAGDAAEAAQLYESALKGPFASDPDLRFGAARASVECQRFAAALPHLQALKAERPEFRPDQVLLLLARCYAGTSRSAEARESFEEAVRRFGSFEAHAEFSIWALATGDAATAARLQTEIDRQVKQWNPISRELNEPVMRRLKAAHELARKGG